MMRPRNRHPAPTRFEALQLVVEAYGSQEATADALGVHQSTVSRWLDRTKQLPHEHVLKAEEDTGVPRYLTRPDVYPRNMPPPPVWPVEESDGEYDQSIVPVAVRHNGNRTHILDSNTLRRAAR